MVFPLCEHEIGEDDVENQYETIELEKMKMDKANTFDCWSYFTEGWVRMKNKG